MCPDRDVVSAASGSEPLLTVWLAGPTARTRFEPEQQTPADRERWQRIVNPQRREEWEVSRALLNHVRTRPTVAAPSERLSLSHSGGFAAVAASGNALRLGVDLECERVRDVTRLAKFAFSDSESEQLAALPAEARTERFYFLWTLKEAFAKALSLPLMESVRRCAFVYGDNGWQGSAPTSEAWSAWVFRPTPEMVLSVVAVGAATAFARKNSVLLTAWPAEQRDSNFSAEDFVVIRSEKF